MTPATTYLPGAARWLAYLDGQTWEHGRLDANSYAAFLRAVSLEIEAGVAVAEVAARIEGAGGHPSLAKLRQQANRAQQFAEKNATLPTAAVARRPKPTFSEEALERVAANCAQPPSGWTKTLASLSSVVVDGLSPADVLRALYRPNDRILIFTDHRSQGDASSR